MLDDLKKVYFLGIGGIGMSAIARYLLLFGKEVYGYDRTCTKLTKMLESEGMQIHYDDDVIRIPENIDLVIYTPAIPVDNQILNHLKDQNIPFIKRAEALGLICENKKMIGVAGTHGKTTTSAILSMLLHGLGAKNSAFVGGIMTDIQSNFLYGNGEWVVVEADEYDRSFWKLFPDVAIILSMDADHLDIYGDADTMTESFRVFSLQIKVGGTLWIHNEVVDKIDTDWRKALEDRKIKVCVFGESNGNVYATNIVYSDNMQMFDCIAEKEEVTMNLQLPGRHNISNATAAIGVAIELGYELENIRNSLSQFKGIKRRFEIAGKSNRYVLVDDYAHHPTEIKAAVQGGRDFFGDRKLTGIFQPHLYSRTRDFMEGFAEELSKLDEIILVDIYPAREKPIAGVNSNIIFEKIENKNKYLIKKEAIVPLLEKLDIDIVMVLGAGDIGKEVDKIHAFLFND